MPASVLHRLYINSGHDKQWTTPVVQYWERRRRGRGWGEAGGGGGGRRGEGVGGGGGRGAGTNKKKDLLPPLEIATIIITVIKFCYHQLDPSRYY